MIIIYVPKDSLLSSSSLKQIINMVFKKDRGFGEEVGLFYLPMVSIF